MMKKMRSSVLFALLCAVATMQAQVRSDADTLHDWKFTKGPVDGAEQTAFDDSGWESVSVPHTWNNRDGQDGGNDYYRGVGWYRSTLSLSPKDAGKRVYVKFSSANCRADVFVNGKPAGTHIGGFAAFVFDVSPFVSFGKPNTIAVKVDNSPSIRVAPLSADFTFFGGLTRPVRILLRNPVSISPLSSGSSGVFVTPTNVSERSARVQVAAIVDNNLTSKASVRVKARIVSRENETIAVMDTLVRVDANASRQVDLGCSVDRPHLWNGRPDPYLYHAVVEVFKGRTRTDSVCQTFGIRSYSVTPDSGFFLNGRRYPLHGVAFHEERRDKGRAISREDRKQDMDLLNELGCTYVRLTHYQHDQFIYDYCDEKGIVVWTEVPVVNNVDTAAGFYAENARQQLTELIRQNSNHPSVCFWGLFNEVDFKPGPDPTPLIQSLNDLAHSLDPTRLTTGAAMFDNRPGHWVPDVISWNKYFGWYVGKIADFGVWLDTMHAKHPRTCIGVSEYGVGANTQEHAVNPKQPDPGGPFHPEEYQNIYHETHWKEIERHPFLYATSLWVGFDFSSDGRNEGKNPGVNDKGLVTQDRRIRKDAFFFYKSHWNNEQMAYITSRRFTQRKDSLTEVKVYSNCDSVRIRVNDRLFPAVTSPDRVYRWDAVALRPGVNQIVAEGFRKGTAVSDSCAWVLEAPDRQ